MHNCKKLRVVYKYYQNGLTPRERKTPLPNFS